MAAKSGGGTAGIADPVELVAPFSPLALDIKAAAELGAEAKGIDVLRIETKDLPGMPGSVPLAVRRGANPSVESVRARLEEFRLHPERKRGTATVDTLESFIGLVNRHRTADSAVFADMDWKKPSLTAVIDYHEAEAGGCAAFGQHRVHYPFPLSEEWQAWIAKNGEKMKQADFAWFLEDRIPELSAPTDAERILYERDFSTTVANPAQVVELSRGLAVHVETKVKNAITLSSGEGQIVFDETHQDGAGGRLKVPGIFILQVSPFFMGDPVRIPCRLRYRPMGGTIVWFYEIWRPDQVITEHVRRAFKDALEGTGLPGFEGKPEMRGD